MGNSESSTNWRGKASDALRRAMRATLRHGERLPRGARSVAGVALMAGGVVGFLPVLGFWMIPAGALLVASDVPPLRRWIARKLGK